jgi:hypothetical protein
MSSPLPAAPPALRQWMQRTEVQLGMCVLGVVGSLLIYGVLQVRRRGLARERKKRGSLGRWERERGLNRPQAGAVPSLSLSRARAQGIRENQAPHHQQRRVATRRATLGPSFGPHARARTTKE